jgi:hypothetical protein
MDAGGHFICINLERVDYSVSEHELLSLMNSSQNSWKDFCIASAGVGIPCVINAVVGIKRAPFEIDVSLFLNTLFGIIGVVLAIVFGILWKRTATNVAAIMEAIKNKPKLRLS